MLDVLKRFIRVSPVLLLLGLLSASMPAAAQVTSLSMSSEPGDYIGGGQSYFYSASDGTFSAFKNYDGGVSIYFNSDGYGHWWNLSFAAPDGVPLTVGSYPNATRFPFQGSGAGLDVSGDGRGCNMLTGSFQVLQVVYGPDDTVTAFDATFEQHCEGGSAALRGEIRYNAQVPLYLSVPSKVQGFVNQPISFPITATDELSRHVGLSASGLPNGATFTDLGNNTGTFAWTPSGNQTGEFVVTFYGDNQQGNQVSTSTRINVRPPPPANDDIDSAQFISGLPSTYTEDATNATSAPDDPWCYGNAQSVWFDYTPQVDQRIEVNTFGSSYDTALSVYTGSRGALTSVGCNEDTAGSVQSRVRFDAIAGTTYHIMASSLFYPVPTANLVLNIQPAPPPFSINPSVSQFGTVVSSTGVVTISGSVECTEPAYVSLNGYLKQLRGGAPVNGYWNAWVPCDGVTPWSATVMSTGSLFHGRSALLFGAGKANVGASASAFLPETGEYRQADLSVIVTLRGKK